MDQPGLRPEGAGHGVDPGAQGRVHQVGIAQGGLHLTVTQQLADHFQRGAAADQQGRKGVAQVMDPDVLQPALLLDLRPEAAEVAQVCAQAARLFALASMPLPIL